MSKNFKRNTPFNNYKDSTPVSQKQLRQAVRTINRNNNLASILVNGPNDPQPIIRDVIIEKVVEINATASPYTLTRASVVNAIGPSAAAFFTQVRPIRMSAYAEAFAGSLIGVIISEDTATFVDHGVQGSRRPCLHVRFPLEERDTWLSVSNTNAIATITAAANATVPPTVNILLQVTIQLRSTSSES